MPKITPFLWFDKNAEEAVDFYLSVFPNSRRTGELRSGEAGPGPKGSIVTISFELDGQPFTALNGGPQAQFNDAISFFVHCKDQAEIDSYWSKLLEGGGEEIACGWLKDRFGVRWQVVPKNIMELVNNPGGMRVMMTMKKLDIAVLQAAAKQGR
ncbi:MAG TPA: VOC family protein [Acidobacteriaceae bacterium]|nr:VOC family protein [Acidobacteriaceae bacterium]